MTFNITDVAQMMIGTVLGAAMFVNLEKAKLSMWAALGVTVVFLYTYLLLSDLVLH